MYIEELFEDDVIFHAQEELFTVPYRVDGGIVTIVGIPTPVERIVSFEPKVNTKGEAMKDMILNALKEAGIPTEGLDDDALFAKYNEHLEANQISGDGNEADSDGQAIADVVSNAMKPIVEKLDSLEGQINANADADVEKYADIVANSGKFPGLDADSAKALGLDKLKEMAANCGHAHGVSPIIANVDDKNVVSSKMPGDD